MRQAPPNVPAALLALVLACASGCDAAPAPGERPNIVLLVSDDQDWEHFGFLGHPLARTPTLDRLAEQGAVFTHGFVPMSRCRPAQASVLSGLWPHQSGVYYNVGADFIDPDTCIANKLAAAGYATIGEGKFWEVNPRMMGFGNAAILNYETFAREGQDHLFRWIDEHAGGERPMFVWWAPMLPHVPHDPPAELLERFDPDAIEVPAWAVGDAEAFRELEHVSLAMEAWLDDALGELVAKLESVGEYENTLFCFLVDNGYSNGLPSKGTAFDKGLRTPFVITWPGGLAGGQRHGELVSTVDLYTTLLDFAGAEIPAEAPGRSLRPLLEGRPGDFTPREALYGAVYLQSPAELESDPARDAYALWARDGRYKYVWYLRDVRESDDEIFKIQANAARYPERNRGDEDLYDLESDPYELRNLADRPEHAARLDRMRQDVLDWWRESGGGELDLPPEN